MDTRAPADYSALDTPAVLQRLFHPRPDPDRDRETPDAEDILVPADDGAKLHVRWRLVDKQAANLLFFHGNGEIVADYDALSRIYAQLRINLVLAEYRGYGRSTGKPTATHMMQDVHTIFSHVRSHLRASGHTGPLALMGRSLGSAAVLELVASQGKDVAALIVESGFAHTLPLLRVLGVGPDRLPAGEAQGFGNLEKIRTFSGPTLIIHAERDHIIPFSDGQALYAACPARDKTFLRVPRANHNNIMQFALKEYLAAVAKLLERAGRAPASSRSSGP